MNLYTNFLLILLCLFGAGCGQTPNAPINSISGQTAEINSAVELGKFSSQAYSPKHLQEFPADYAIQNGREKCLEEADKSPAGVCIITQEKNNGKTVDFYVRNTRPGFVTVQITPQPVNMESTSPIPYNETFSPNTTTKIFTLAAINAAKRTGWSYDSSFRPGSMYAKHDDSYIYTLPYEIGTTHVVGQGYNSVVTHFGELAYSIDWLMDEEGIPVMAAREGIVIEIVDSFKIGEPDPSYWNYSNHIVVQHLDGTVAYYGHHQHKGAKVKVGDKVKAGDTLALAGCTGFCSTPHVHFHVSKPVSGGLNETLPTKFKVNVGPDGKIIAEKIVGEIYYTAPGPSPLPRPQDAFSEDSLTRIPDKLAKIVNDTPDPVKASEAFRDYIKNNSAKINQQWKDLNARAMAGDREAPKELGVILDTMLSLYRDYRFGKILDLSPYDPETGAGAKMLPAAEESLLLWGQLFSLGD